MKRALSLLLSVLLLISLIACQKKEEEKSTSEDEIFAKLSAEELYRTAFSNQNKLSSSSYQTTVLISGEEKDKIATVRVRSGFDDFRYSRTSLVESFFFTGKVAAAIDSSCAFRAPASSRSFQAFLDDYVFPVTGLSPDALSDFVREGNRVSYTAESETMLALFSRMTIPGEDGTFTVTALSGTATISPAGYFTAEEIHLTGTAHRATGDSDMKVSLSTSLVKAKSEEIEALPIPEGTYVEVDDLSRVYRLADALMTVQGETNVTATAVSSEAIQNGDRRLSLDTTAAIYQADTGAFSSTRNLRRGLSDKEEEWVEEVLLNGQTRRRTVFDAVTADTLSDEESEDASVLLWPSAAARIIPALSDFSSLPATDNETDFDSFSFTLSRDAIDRLKNLLAAAIPGSGAESAVLESADGNGSITLKDGHVFAISYSYSGAFSGGSITGNITLTLERARAGVSITLPQIQPPEIGASAPDAGGDIH